MKSLVFKPLISILLMCASLLLTAIVSTATSQDTPAFDKLKSAFENGLIFNADFTHRYEDSFTGEIQNSEGVIWIGKEQYKIEGSNQIMVVDDDISQVYDGSKNRVIISDYVEEEDDFAPSRMLQGADTSYSVQEISLDNGNTEIQLRSDDPFSIFEQVTIHLNAEGNPMEINALDQAENILITRFSNGSFNPSSESLFKLEYPENAELIDLRYNSQ